MASMAGFLCGLVGGISPSSFAAAISAIAALFLNLREFSKEPGAIEDFFQRFYPAA